MPTTAERSVRGVSPILLVLAALCFLLPFVGVSCNTSAGGAALGSALSQAGGAGNSGNAAAVTTCLQGLSGRDLVTYSGVNLLTGGTPTAATSIPGCDTGSSSSSSASSTVSKDAGIGVQPLMVVALLLILLGIVAGLLRAPARAVIAGGAALVAAVLIVINNSTVHTPILNKLTSSGGGASISSLGLTGGLGLENFFSIHAAIGFILVLIALVLALAANGVDAALGSRLRLATAEPDWRAPPPGGPVAAHPPPGVETRPPSGASPPEQPPTA
jgi:hypothetical protein